MVTSEFSPPYDGTHRPHYHTIVYGFAPTMVLLDYMGIPTKITFSSHYGDGTFSSLEDAVAARFSPPYGDGTGTLDFWHYADKFSPPCGDRTLNISQNTAKLKSRMARKYSLYYNDVLLR